MSNPSSKIRRKTPKYQFTLGPVDRGVLSLLRYFGIRVLGWRDPEATRPEHFEFDSWFRVPSLIRFSGVLEWFLLQNDKTPFPWHKINPCSHPALITQALDQLDGYPSAAAGGICLYHNGNICAGYETAPLLLYLDPVGDAAAVWIDPNSNHLAGHILWFRNGVVHSRHEGMYGICYETNQPLPDLTLSAVVEMMRSSLEDRLNCFKALWSSTMYCQNTHNVVLGKEHSVIIHETRTGAIDNPYGPAVLTAHGLPMFFRRGWRVERSSSQPRTGLTSVIETPGFRYLTDGFLRSPFGNDLTRQEQVMLRVKQAREKDCLLQGAS